MLKTSSQNGGSDARLEALKKWLTVEADPMGTHGLAVDDIVSASSDASFRRYFRVPCVGSSGHKSLIVMDAPPPQEDCKPFVSVAHSFAQAGAAVPTIFAQDLERGFLLLSDFGNQTFWASVNEQSAAVANPFYSAALNDLVALQAKFNQNGAEPAEPSLPPYSREVLLRELMLYPQWYVAKHKKITLSAAQNKILLDAFELIIANNLAQAKVAVHRDYHSRNLMVLANPQTSLGLASSAKIGMIDFQDALWGPASYDVVSLLRDAYIEWEEHDVLDWAIRYWEKARTAGIPLQAEFGDFYRDFEWMGLQRHLKVLGIFARLAHRDGKERYLADIPLVLKYALGEACRYRALGPLAQLMQIIEGATEQSGYTF